jgi:hypothetical protein
MAMALRVHRLPSTDTDDLVAELSVGVETAATASDGRRGQRHVT